MDTDGPMCSLSLLVSPIRTLLAVSAGGENHVGGLIALFVVFVVCGAYFGGSESGFSAMNKIRVKSKAEDGNRRAKNAMYIANNFDRALTTLLIGNNITHIAAASIATVIATRLFGTSDVVSLVCTIVTTLIVFLFSEMIPKAYANDRSETASLASAGFLRFLMKILYPLAVFFTAISSAFTSLASRFVKSEEEPSITEEELYDIIDTIEEEGVMNEEQGDLIKSALDFSDTHAADVMTMRGDIFAIDSSLPSDEILALVIDSIHSRIPVYEGDIDHIIGIVHTRTFLREYVRTHRVDIRSKSVLMPAYKVSPDAMIDELLEEMRQHKFYLSVVSDDSGKTLGLVTIEDFLEELVGEIWDEDDVVDKNFIKLGGNRFLVNTHMTIGEMTERLGLPPIRSQSPIRPLLSVILEHFGEIPEEDESFMLTDNLEVTIDTVEGSRVTDAVLRLIDENGTKEAEAE